MSKPVATISKVKRPGEPDQFMLSVDGIAGMDVLREIAQRDEDPLDHYLARTNNVGWLLEVANEINTRLGAPLFEMPKENGKEKERVA